MNCKTKLKIIRNFEYLSGMLKLIGKLKKFENFTKIFENNTEW